MTSIAEIESLPAGAGIVHVGPLSFVTPWPQFRATASQMAKLEMACIQWVSPQLSGIGQRLCTEIEAEMSREARRRAKMEASDRIIVPAKASGAIRTGGPALFVDDGRSERVLVLSPEEPHPESGEPEREVSFLDKAGEVFMVKAANLSPCDDLFRALPLAPDALETGKWAGAPREAESYRPRIDRREPAFDKFDRVAPVKPEDVRLDLARMTPQQRERLRVAEAKLAQAERRKAERSYMLLGRVRYDRMTPAEKAERADYAETMAKLQQETLAANDRAEVSRGRVETLALEQMRGGAMAVHADGHLTRKNGLDTLLSSGAITRLEYVAGDKFAGIYADAKAGEIKIANWGGSGGGSAPDPERERLMRLKELAAKKALTDIERFIVQTVSHKRALWAVRLVAGEGKHLAHISASGGRPSGGHRATNTKALQLALQALADHWGLQ